MKASENALNGMKEICGYANRSEPTIVAWIRTHGFPAKKRGGVWTSSRKAIDRWFDRNGEVKFA